MSGKEHLNHHASTQDATSRATSAPQDQGPGASKQWIDSTAIQSADAIRRTPASNSQVAGERLRDAPHVVLVTETPCLHGAFPLVLHLAQLEAEKAPPVLIVD